MRKSSTPYPIANGWVRCTLFPRRARKSRRAFRQSGQFASIIGSWTPRPRRTTSLSRSSTKSLTDWQDWVIFASSMDIRATIRLQFIPTIKRRRHSHVLLAPFPPYPCHSDCTTPPRPSNDVWRLSSSTFLVTAWKFSWTISPSLEMTSKVFWLTWPRSWRSASGNDWC